MKSERKHSIADTKFRQVLIPTLLMATTNNLLLFVSFSLTSILCGDDRLAAVQIVTPIQQMQSFIIWTIGIGGSILCFEKKAKGKSREGDSVFTLSIILLLVTGIIMCVTCLVFDKNILSVLCLEPDIRLLSEEYLEVLAFSFIPTAYVMGLSYFVRADGYPNLPFVVALISNIVILVTGYVYISIFGLDIEGVGLANVTGYVVGAAIISKYFFNKDRTVKFKLQVAKIQRQIVSITKYGIPASSMQLYVFIKNIILNRIISGISAAATIAFSVFNSEVFIPSILYVAVAQTLSPLVVAFYQIGDYSSTKHLMKKALLIISIATAALAALTMIFPNITLELMNINEPDAEESVLLSLKILPLTYIGLGIVFILTYYLQSIGKLKIASIIAFIDGFAISTLLAIVLNSMIGEIGIWISISFTPVITMLLYSGFVLKRKKGLLFIPDIPDSLRHDMFVGTSGDEIALALKNIDDESTATQFSKTVQYIRKINSKANEMEVSLLEKKDKQILLQVKDTGREYTAEELSKIEGNVDYFRISGINCVTVGK